MGCGVNQLMSSVKETIQELIEFSEKQQAYQRKKLAAAGKSQSNAWVDAFSNIIGNLSSLLGDDKQKKQSDDAADESSEDV